MAVSPAPSGSIDFRSQLDSYVASNQFIDTLNSNKVGSSGYDSDKLATRARTVDGQQYYVARIIQPSSNIIFRAFVPETFNISIQNHWEPLFGELNETNRSFVTKAGAAAGAPINLKYFSRLIWLGTEPLSFNFTFLLDAYGNTEADVEKPITDLIRMATPQRGDLGFLKSPGPNMISDERRIYMRIGKFFFIDSIVIDSVDVTFYTIADAGNGKFMSADINVHVRTAYTPDQQDILNYFNKGASGDNSLNNQIPSGIKTVNDVIGKATEIIKGLGNSIAENQPIIPGGG